MVVHPEAVAVLVADRPEDPGRVLDEGQVVEDPDALRSEVAPASERVDEPAEVVALERGGHRVDREVAPEQVLPDRGVLHRRKRCRCVVELRPGRDDVDSLPVAVYDHRRAELLVWPNAPAELRGDAACEIDRVAFDCDVHVEALLSEEDVANGAAHEVDPVVRLAGGRDCFERAAEPVERDELVGDRLAGPGELLLLGPDQLPEQVRPRDDPDEGVPSQDRDAARAGAGDELLEL